MEIQRESARILQEQWWRTASESSGAQRRDSGESMNEEISKTPREIKEANDNYSFELVSMLLSLSVSEVGQQFITSSLALVRTLLLLIATG